jgi:hypothetical protein
MLERLRLTWSRLVRTWLHSDLIGIPMTAVIAGIVLISLLVTFLAGSLGGLVFIVLIGAALGLLLRLEGGEAPEAMADVTSEPAGGMHKVLVVANHGLEEEALCAEVCQRGARTNTEAMILAPVLATTRLHTLADDHGQGSEIAQQRVNVALETLEAEGIKASGHIVLAQPMQALIDGLREFQATEVVLLSGGELGWEDAYSFAERVRVETGLRVTEVTPS